MVGEHGGRKDEVHEVLMFGVPPGGAQMEPQGPERRRRVLPAAAYAAWQPPGNLVVPSGGAQLKPRRSIAEAPGAACRWHQWSRRRAVHAARQPCCSNVLTGTANTLRKRPPFLTSGCRVCALGAVGTANTPEKRPPFAEKQMDDNNLALVGTANTPWKRPPFAEQAGECKIAMPGPEASYVLLGS